VSEPVSREVVDVVEAASRVAGSIAARGRGDIDGARELLASFDSHEELSAGALLVADMALKALCEQTGESLEDCVGLLSLRLLSIRG
jgi:hypothetical protein